MVHGRQIAGVRIHPNAAAQEKGSIFPAGQGKTAEIHRSQIEESIGSALTAVGIKQRPLIAAQHQADDGDDLKTVILQLGIGAPMTVLVNQPNHHKDANESVEQHGRPMSVSPAVSDKDQ